MDHVRWGMIGCGAVTEVKSAPGLYKASRSTLVAVTDRNLDAARSYAARHGVGRVDDSVEALLADPGIDAVYVATPPVSHKELALAVARAGKHVYVEKPMALRRSECDEIVATCAARGVRLFVAFYRRGMPRFLQVLAWLEAGAIGEVRSVRVMQHQPPAAEERSRATLPWRLSPEVAGGGKFLDMGVHVLDILDLWLGPIAEVKGVAGNQGGLYDVEDTVTAAWRHAGGVQGSGSWCYVCDAARDLTEITGTRGRIELDFFADSPLRLIVGSEVTELAVPNPPHVQQPFIQSIVDELCGGPPCRGDIASAIRATAVADDVLRDYRLARGWAP